MNVSEKTAVLCRLGRKTLPSHPDSREQTNRKY